MICPLPDPESIIMYCEECNRKITWGSILDDPVGQILCGVCKADEAIVSKCRQRMEVQGMRPSSSEAHTQDPLLLRSPDEET